MAFYLFLLLNGVLFVRPGDLVPELEDFRIYELVILGCLATSAPRILKQLTIERLREQPILVAAIGLLAAVAFSHLSHGRMGDAADWGFRFFKILAYYCLFITVVDTPARLRTLLLWIGALVLGMTLLVLAQHAGYVDLPSLVPVEQNEVNAETGEVSRLVRLCGVGIFNDPNDLSVILVVGMMIGLYGARDGGIRRVFWSASVAVMGYALTLTHSRGGFLALLAAVFSLSIGWFGFRKAALIGIPLVVGLAVAFGGRQTNFDLDNADDTSQHRIRLWRDGLVLMQQSPAFGIGAGRYEDEVGLVAHNSFVHSYVELGLFGGTLFVGAFLLPLVAVGRSRAARASAGDTTLESLKPVVLACLAGTVGGMLSLSRLYSLTPYMVLGMTTVYLGLVKKMGHTRTPNLTFRLVVLTSGISFFFLACTRLFVQLVASNG